MLKIHTFQFNSFQECCALAWDQTGEAIIIDPGFYNESEASELYNKIEKENLSPKMILLTHGHFDHVFGAKECAEKFNIPILMHEEDRVILENNHLIAPLFGLQSPICDFSTTPINDGEILSFGNTSFKVITTPGHSPGGVCYYFEEEKVLFSGDTLFAGSIGRTDNLLGDYDKLIVSIMDKLMGLDSDTGVVPGHGPTTNIGHERTHNPFLQPFNEPGGDDFDWDDEGIELQNDDLK